MTLLFPKPQYRKEQLKRKRELREKDREFQSKATGSCIVPLCPRPCGKHHTVKRRHKESRHDPSKAIDICWFHHVELEQIGDVDFQKKYGIFHPLLKQKLKTLNIFRNT